MNFKYSAFIENTPEMREWCVKNGITPFLHNKSLNDLGKYIKVFGEGLRVYSCSDITKDVDGIDCTGNPQLFRAVTALRDDSDYMQWYYSSDHEEKQWWLSDRHVVKNHDCMINNERVWHKATLKELQEYFKITNPKPTR